MRREQRFAWALVGLLVHGHAFADPNAIYEKHQNSVVAVTYYVETRFMQQVHVVEGRDIGIVVSDDMVMIHGAVVTSSSTGALPHDYRVRFANGVEIPASFVGRDEFANVAFIRLEGTLPGEVSALSFGKSPRVKVGDEVYVLGLLPENLDPMVRLASGKIVAAIKKPKPFLVTDLDVGTALGAPVFTRAGKLLGVLSELGGAGPAFTAGFGGAEEGYYGMILDLPTLKPLIADPPLQGKSRRAWLGITLQALDDDMADYWHLKDRGGIIINSVVPRSPADRAGLQEGDLVVAMNGEPIPVHKEDHVPIFIEEVGSSEVGSDLELEVLRNGRRMNVDVTLVGAPKSRLDAEKYNNPEFELTVRELVFADYRALELDPDFQGVLVSHVEQGSWSDVGGLHMGDIIQRIDSRDITSPQDVQEALEKAQKTKTLKIVFFVRRFSRTLFLTVQPNWEGNS